MKKQKDALKLIYSFLLGIVIALFIGIGINTFYPAPENIQSSAFSTCDAYKTETLKFEDCVSKEQRDMDAKMDEYNKQNKSWASVVSIVVIIAATIFATIALTFSANLEIISNGILLGSIFTLLYGVITGFMSENRTIQFIVVTVSLVVTLAIGYIKFIRAKDNK
jgi:hypothetical protein